MQRPYYFLILSVLLPLFGMSQNEKIQGTVLEAGAPLEGVRVMLDSLKGAYTDSSGTFELSTEPGTHRLELSYIGYAPLAQEVEVIAGEDLVVQLEMKKEEQEFELVVISSSMYKKNIAEETVSMDVLDEEIVENNNAVELGEAVERGVGIQAQDGQITIRGGSSWAYGVGSRTAVYIDNLPFQSADLGDAQLKHAPMENIDQIEIIKGASSVVFGSSALNGVVNAVTAWPTSEKQTQVAFFQGVYDKPPRPELQWWDRTEHPNNSGMWFNHSQKFGNLDVVAGGNMYQQKSFIQQGDEMRFRFNVKTRYWSKKKEGLSYGVNANVMRENWGRVYLAEDMRDNAYRKGDGSYDRYWRYNIDPHVAYRNDEKQLQHRFDSRIMQVTRLGSGDDPNATSIFGFGHYQYQRTLRDKIVLTGGLPFTVGTGVSNLYEGRKYMFTGASYVQAEYKRENLSLVGGIRYEVAAVDVIFEASLPTVRAGLNYKVAENTWVRTSWGTAYRLPTIGERFIEAGFDILTIFPNPELEAETGWSYELGVKQGIKVNKWNGYADFALFWNEYDNFVEYQLGVYPPPGVSPTLDYLGLKPFNLEKTRIAGFEGEVVGKGDIGPINLTGIMGYTYHYPGNLDGDTTQRALGPYLKNAMTYLFNRVEDEYDDNGNLEVENTARILAMRNRHLIKADAEAAYKRFALGGNLTYQSGLEKTELLFDLAAPGLSDFVAAQANGDWIFSARAAYYPLEDLRVSLIIKNLTNREYMIRPGRVEAPRSFTVQVKYSF